MFSTIKTKGLPELADTYINRENSSFEGIMSISINEQTPSVTMEKSSGQQLLTAALAKSQQELEGKMALELLQSADIATTPQSLPVNLGNNINIKV